MNLPSTKPPLRIGLFRPDVMLGGGERLMVDAALAFRSAGHLTRFLATRHDPARSFAETRSGEVSIETIGRWLPSHIAGHLIAPCSIVRCLYLALRLARTGALDVVFCDTIPHAIPLLKRITGAQVVYYCHFPDFLLAPRRWGPYRWALDLSEAKAIQAADLVLVNSRFTGSIFRDSFPGTPDPVVCYPGVDLNRFRPRAEDDPQDRVTILSIQRFEPSKNVPMAIDALAALRPLVPADLFGRVELVLAGGHDPLYPANSALLRKVRQSIVHHGLESRVRLLPNATDAELNSAMARARVLLYTPVKEHFGIVPLEAMSAGVPVVGSRAGGLLETVRDGDAGFLVPPTAADFAAALARYLSDNTLARRHGKAGRAHVEAHFSRAAFASRVVELVEATTH